jgi:hypothetical protein
MPIAVCFAVALLTLGYPVARAAAEPGIALRDDGRTIVYRAGPGDTAAAVAQALGVSPAELSKHLAAQGVRDADRVPVGFEYRIPNPLAARADAAAQRAGDLERRLAAAESRAAGAEGQLAGVQRTEGLQDEQWQRLAQLEGRWRLAFWAIVGLSLALAVAGAVAAVARRRERGATHYARSMAHELEEKRRSGLAERQHSARRIVELEDRVRQLEAQLGDPVRGVPRSA